MNPDSDEGLSGGAEEQSSSILIPVFRRPDWLSFAATAALMLVVYGFTLTPDTGLEFSGIYSVAGLYAGVPHPPGYPLSTLWWWVFIKLLPFSNIAWRAAVGSAAAGALSCGLIALMVSRVGAVIAEHTQSGPSLSRAQQCRLRGGCGAIAGMTFGLNGAFWPSAVVPDVWPLSILLLGVVLWLLTRWAFEPSFRRYLYGAAFVYGLTLTNSQIELAFAPAIPFLVMFGDQRIGRDFFLVATTAFVVALIGEISGRFPLLREYGSGAFAIFLVLGGVACLMSTGLVLKTRQVFSEWKAVLICGGLVALGLAACMYVPIASMTDPPINWGYARTVEGFFHTLSRGQYERMHPTDSVARYWIQVVNYSLLTGREFGWLGLLAAVVPFGFLGRIGGTGRDLILGFLAVWLCLTFLILAMLNPSGDKQSLDLVKAHYSASYVPLALLAGVGLVCLGSRVTKPTVASRTI